MKTSSLSLDKKPIQYFKHKGWILEYHPSLGWIYFKPRDKKCTVVYVEHKKDALKYLEEDIKLRK